MGHRVGIYEVCVRSKGRGNRDDWQPLGDFDGEGHNLRDELESLMVSDEFEQANQEATKHIWCEEVGGADPELNLLLRHGESGVRADIYDDLQRDPVFQQMPKHTSEMQCGALFLLPADSTQGWLACHTNNGRGIAGLLSRGLRSWFLEYYPDHMLAIRPHVVAAALDEAIAHDRVESVTLIQRKEADDTGSGSMRMWVDDRSRAKVALEIAASGIRKIKGDLLKRARTGERAAINEILRYEGLQFEEAQIHVTLATGGKKTYNLERPESGHAMTEELADLPASPTKKALMDALRRSLGDYV